MWPSASTTHIWLNACVTHPYDSNASISHNKGLNCTGASPSSYVQVLYHIDSKSTTSHRHFFRNGAKDEYNIVLWCGASKGTTSHWHHITSKVSYHIDTCQPTCLNCTWRCHTKRPWPRTIICQNIYHTWWCKGTTWHWQCGVASISRLLKITGLFCRISSLLKGFFAKETYNFKEPTTRSHPISRSGTHMIIRKWLHWPGWFDVRGGLISDQLMLVLVCYVTTHIAIQQPKHVGV